MHRSKELDDISKKLIKLEKLQEKAEEDGIYDDSIYKEIESLEARRQELLELENSIDQEAI